MAKSHGAPNRISVVASGRFQFVFFPSDTCCRPVETYSHVECTRRLKVRYQSSRAVIILVTLGFEVDVDSSESIFGLLVFGQSEISAAGSKKIKWNKLDG